MVAQYATKKSADTTGRYTRTWNLNIKLRKRDATFPEVGNPEIAMQTCTSGHSHTVPYLNTDILLFFYTDNCNYFYTAIT